LIKQIWQKQALPSEEYASKALPQILNTSDLTMVFMMIMFFINNPVSTARAGAVSFTYWVIGAIVFFIPCVIATAQLGSMFPYEGSTYNWTHKALGGFWSLFASVSYWMPGVLGMVVGAGISVTFIQGLHADWLTEPWQQGLLLIGILLFSAFLSTQRLRVVLTIVKVVMLLTWAVIALLGLAAIVWLLTGHHSATNFAATRDWAITPGTFGLFGTVTLAYLGANVSLNMGGEVATRKAIPRHLLLGGIGVIVCYLIVTLALLVVQGANATSVGPFAIVELIDQVFGKFLGNIAAVCVIAFFPIFTTVLNCSFARLLMVASIDRRLPIWLGKLNKNRAPANAITFQTLVAIVFALFAFLAPYIIAFTKPADLANEIFTISLSALTLMWAISTSFLFVDLAVLYFRDRNFFRQHLIVPMPILWACIIVGPVACILAIVVTLYYSPIPQLMGNNQWGYLVGGLTAGCLIIAAVASMFATSEATWQDQVGTNDIQWINESNRNNRPLQ
jgi:glutamate:GABA antiporter